MGPGETILTYGYPILLLAGALCRISIPSFIYLVCFAITTIWMPHALLPKRKIVINVIAWILTGFAGLICIGHIVFQSVMATQPDYGRKWLPDDSTLTLILQYVGVQRIGGIGEGFRLITADVVVFLASLIFAILLRLNKIFSREYEGYAKQQMSVYIPSGPSTLNSLSILALMFLNGLAFASGLQAVYFVVFQAVLVGFAFFRLSLFRLIDIIYWPIFIYDMMHILGVYTTQADPIRSRIPRVYADALGFKFYDVDITPNPLMGVTICLSWASSIILLVLLAFRKRNIDLRALTAIDRSYLPGNGSGPLGIGRSPSSANASVSSSGTNTTRFWRLFRRAVRSWGWRISVVGLLAIPLFLPSFFSVFLLFTVCIASVVPQATLEKYWIVPGVTIYLILISSMQYIYNIPSIGSTCEVGQKDPLCAVGLRVFPYTWFQIGLQTLACVMLSLNWGYYVTQDEADREDIQRRKRNKQLDETLLEDTDSDVTEGLLLSDQEALEADRGHHQRQRSRRSSGSHTTYDPHTSSGPESSKRRRAPGSNSSSNRGSNRSYGNERFAVWSGGDDHGSEYHTFTTEHSLGVEDFERPTNRGSSSRHKSDEAEKPKTRCAGCWSRLSQWWKDFKPVLKAVGFWALKQSYLLSLGGVYIAGLHQVTILNSVYLLLFILFLTSPVIARRFWLVLVLYCETVILVVYTWSATPWTNNINAPRILSMIGLRTYTNTNDLFTQGLVWHLVIMLFGVIQLWVLRYTASLAQDGKDKPTEKIPRWMRAVGDTFFWAWDEYGLIPVYTVLIFVASSDGDISLINILYITLLFVCLSIHMMTRHADVHIKRFWIFVVIASGIILLARYAYQFPFIQELLQNLLQESWIIEGIGFIVFKSQTVFFPLLGNTFVFLVAVIQLQTFFAKKESPAGVGHNAHARRLATAADFEFESDYGTGMESSDWDEHGSLGRQTFEGNKPSSLPGSFKFGAEADSSSASSSVSLHDDEHVPLLGTSVPSRGHLASRPRQHVHFDKATSSKVVAVSEDEARILAERGSSARAERQVSASQHLLMDPELMAEDIRKHPTSTLRARKRRLKRKHVLETIIYIWSLDIIYWLKRFCMIHAYKITALVLMAIAAKAPSGLNSVYVEIAILSVSADHLTDGVGLLLLLYTQLTVLFMLIFQFAPVYNALSAYLPLVQWAGFEYLPQNRLSLITSRLVIICMLLLQRFSHRWKNDWYRVKKIEIEHELDPMHMENVELHYSQLMAKHGVPDLESPPISINDGDTDNIKAAAEKLHQFSSQGSSAMSEIPEEEDDGLVDLESESKPKPALPSYLNSPAHANSRYGILQQLQSLMMEDDRDNEAIESLKKRYLHKTELTLFLYDSSDFLVMKDHFSFREAWNLFAWFLSNLLLIAGYPVLVCTILMVIWVHKETLYGIVFLLILGLTIVTSRVKWASNGLPIKVLTVYVAIEILLQYILNLDLPPPDLRYPWSTWDPHWLAWLGLKQLDLKSGMLIADFVLLLVLARIRRVTTDDLRQLQWSRYWHYLVGPVTRHVGEPRTWRDSVRYAVYRFSPFVILLLIFIAGTVHPDILSLIYVFFALLFIFRESTIYAQRNQIWRWARLYNYLLMLVIIIYQVPAIPTPSPAQDYMSVSAVLGLRKFSQQGSSILFSLFIFILLGVQKRLFSRVEFDELVLSILDTEERGVRFAQERFQEWKMERRREFERVQEEKRKRRQQLDFLKAARTRQQKIWLRLAKGGAAPGTQDSTLLPSGYPTNAGDAALLAAAHTAATAAAASAVGNTPTVPPPGAAGHHGHDPFHPAMDYVHDPRMRTITSRDLKLLQSTGGLAIEEDPQSKDFRLRFLTPSASTTHNPSNLGLAPPTLGLAPSTSGRHLPYPSLQRPAESDDLSEIVVHQRAISPLSGTETTDQEDETDASEEVHGHKRAKSSFGDDSESETSESETDAKNIFEDDDQDGDGEEDVLAAALQESRKPGEVSFGEDDEIETPTCCRCWKTPKIVLKASDLAIGWLDRHTEGYVSTKPHYSRKGKLWAGFYKLYQINSAALCYLCFIINAAVNSDLISLFYPISMFLYALLETPRPHKLYWNTVFVYAAITIITKFFYQISVFCYCHYTSSWSLMNTCSTTPECLSTLPKTAHSEFTFSVPRLIGITSYNKPQGGTGGPFILHVVPDLLVLISVFMHRYWLKKLGYWNFVQRLILSKEGSDEPMSQKQLYEESKRFEQILLKQQKKRETWTKYAAEKRKRRYNKRMEAIAKAGVHDIETAAHLGEYWDNAGVYNGIDDFDKFGDDSDEKAVNVLRYYSEDSLGPLTAKPHHSLGYPSEAEESKTITHTTSSGLKVVTNPLFKAGESDFETDTEEMTTVGHLSSRGPSDVPEVRTSKPQASSTVSDILGVTTSDQATRRRMDDISSPARHTSSSSHRTDTTTSEEDEEESEDDRSESTSERGDHDEHSDDDLGSDYSSTMGNDEEENLYADTTALRRRRALSNAKRWFKGRWKDTRNFFENLFAHKPGRDWYVHIWFVELVCFFFIILLPSPFIGNAGGNIIEFLTQSRLPNSYVLTMLAQFVLIVIERVLYLFRAIKVKVVYHVLLVILYHGWLMFASPIFTGKDFNSQPILISFYLLKMVYLYLSSMQIMHGYPAFVQGQFLTDSNEPGIPRWLVYVAYRAIPFVYELRTLLDWTITKTSLTFFEWLKLEDIYANLFLVKCRVSQDKVMKRNVGDPQEWYVKWGMGVLLFVGLSALIWFPLLILMQGSPGNQQNPIIAATVSVGFTGYASPIYTAVAVQANMKDGQSMGSELFGKLRSQEAAITYDDFSILQWIEFDNFSDASWSISPPAKAHLLDELENAVKDPAAHQTTLSVTLSFTRKFAISSGAVADFSTNIGISDPLDVIHAINGSRGNFSINHLLPRYYRIPNSGPATSLNSEPSSAFAVGGTFDLSSQDGSPFWNCRAIPTTGIFPWDNKARLIVVTFSAEAPRGLLISLASVGLIGLYVGVVLAVARFLRLSVTDLAFRIIYEDMPACEELISYCEDIYLARQDGDLALEEELFRELIEIYRSPETIIGRTMRTHPRFAGRPLSKKEKRRLLKENPNALDHDQGDGGNGDGPSGDPATEAFGIDDHDLDPSAPGSSAAHGTGNFSPSYPIGTPPSVGTPGPSGTTVTSSPVPVSGHVFPSSSSSPSSASPAFGTSSSSSGLPQPPSHPKMD